MAEPIPVFCPSCGKALDPADAYCRFCGMGQGPNLPWYYEAHWIAFLALFALGPFVLPLIWKSPRLSPRGRWIATALTGLLTLYLCYSCLKIYRTITSAWSTSLL